MPHLRSTTTVYIRVLGKKKNARPYFNLLTALLGQMITQQY